MLINSFSYCIVKNSYLSLVKFFAIIFSIYFAYLSTVPCGDKENCNEFAQTHATITTDHNQGNSHQNEICSPFCTCACCGCQGFNLKSFPTVAIAFTQTAERKIIPYQSQFISQFSADIWQPPKV